MAMSKNEKRKQYAHYAAHCMYLVTAATDPDARAIQREMALHLKSNYSLGSLANRSSFKRAVFSRVARA